MFKPHKTPQATSFSCKHLVPLQCKFFCAHSGVCRSLESRSLKHIKGEQTCYTCIKLLRVLNRVVRKINSSVLNLRNAFVLDRHLKIYKRSREQTGFFTWSIAPEICGHMQNNETCKKALHCSCWFITETLV